MVDILDLMKNDYTLPKKYSEMTIEQMEERIHEIKNKLGKRLFIPAHHYQKDEVVQFADATGDCN